MQNEKLSRGRCWLRIWHVGSALVFRCEGADAVLDPLEKVAGTDIHLQNGWTTLSNRKLAQDLLRKGQDEGQGPANDPKPLREQWSFAQKHSDTCHDLLPQDGPRNSSIPDGESGESCRPDE
eukprot:scaffold2135_cov46-Attheya_sp.AAC.3